LLGVVVFNFCSRRLPCMVVFLPGRLRLRVCHSTRRRLPQRPLALRCPAACRLSMLHPLLLLLHHLCIRPRLLRVGRKCPGACHLPMRHPRARELLLLCTPHQVRPRRLPSRKEERLRHPCLAVPHLCTRRRSNRKLPCSRRSNRKLPCSRRRRTRRHLPWAEGHRLRLQAAGRQ